MKKVIKKYLSLVTVFGLLTTILPLNVSAETLENEENFPTNDTYISINNIEGIDNCSININVKEDILTRVNRKELEKYIIDLVNENPDADSINIIDISDIDNTNNNPSMDNRIEESFGTATTKYNVQRDVFLEKRFCFKLLENPKEYKIIR